MFKGKTIQFRRGPSLATLVASVIVLLAASGTSLAQGESVESALRAEGPALSEVTATMENGVAELDGVVQSLAARELAEQIALLQPSVNAVVNRLEVKAPDRKASEIESDYRELLRSDPATETFEIDAVADNGVLTLSGRVDSPAERQLAEMTAHQVRGVRSVENNIRVSPPDTPRADAEIEEEIRSLLKWDVRVDESLVAVSVRDGVVKLAGVARSPAEKTQAITLAHVHGVKAVEAPELLVRLEEGDPQRARRIPVPAEGDGEIARALEKALANDPRVPEDTVQVEVRDGVAYLSGEVDRLSTKRIAEEDADNVLGVVRVVNTVDVAPTADLSDEQIRTNVATTLASDPIADVEYVEIRVEDGVVSLSGKVLSEWQRDRIIEAAARARGALEIDADQLMVRTSS